MKIGIMAAGLCLALVATATPADAALILRLTHVESGVSVTITDGGPGDLSPADGAVMFSGPLGVFVINVSTGLSKPLLPNTPLVAEMDLNSVNVSTAAGTLLIELTDTDFLATPGGTLFGAVGGTTQGTTEFWAYKCGNNEEFCTDGADASIHLGPFSSGAFAGTDSDSHGPLGPYSMTLVAQIQHGDGFNTSSFDFHVQNIVAEPATTALFGLALCGLGVLARRRRSA